MTQRNQQQEQETQEQTTETQEQETQGRADRFTWKPGDVEIQPPSQKAQETAETQPKVNGNTLRAAKAAVAKKEISADSFRAIEAGELSLQEARDLGRDAGPSGPAVRVNKKDRSRPCACGCGQTTRGGVWIPGHDARLPGLVLRAVKGEIELTKEQREHAERRDLFARAEAKLAAQKAKDEAKRLRQ